MSKVFTTKNITRIAIFTALSYVLYMFVKFPIPVIFPTFLDFQISDMPALLAGYMMGPIAGCLVVVVKCLLKLPFTSTGGVGELGDLLLGIAFVLVASLIYSKYRSKKGALISLVIGSIACTVTAVLVNAFILIPFYANLAGGMDSVANMMSNLFPNASGKNILAYYLPLSVVPFNILRCLLSSVITFLVYKRLSRLFDRMFEPQENYLLINGKKCILKNVVTDSEKKTFELGAKLGKKLVGGEVILLSGDLGVGKTVFARGVAYGLGIKEGVVSPTFTLLNCYEGRLKLYHYDAYRLTSAEEAEEKGLTEYFGKKDGVCLIEWPENISDAIPSGAIKVSIKYSDENRREILVADK